MEKSMLEMSKVFNFPLHNCVTDFVYCFKIKISTYNNQVLNAPNYLKKDQYKISHNSILHTEELDSSFPFIVRRKKVLSTFLPRKSPRFHRPKRNLEADYIRTRQVGFTEVKENFPLLAHKRLSSIH